MADRRSRNNNEGASTVAQTTPAKRINFSNVGQPVDPGEYTLQLLNHSWAVDKNNEDRVNLIFTFPEDERYSSKKQFAGFSPYGDQAYYLMDALVQLGVDPDEFMDIGADENQPEEEAKKQLDLVIKSAYGAKVKAVIGHTQGKDKNGNDRIYANITSMKSI